MANNPIQKIGQIAVPVNDIQRTIHFYKDILGLTLLFSMERMAFFDCHGVRLFMSLPEKEEFSQSSSTIYFQVEDIKSKYKELLEKDVTFIDEPHLIAKMGNTETWMAFFKDPDNNIHALMSEFEN